MNNRLTTKEYWKRYWQEIPLPQITNPLHDVHKTLSNILPRSDKMSFLEIGCAPGRWMAYFNKHFSYTVCGIDYVEDAVVATRKNMEMQGIIADVLNLDFFEAAIAAASYDVVFSAGFIEHFDDLGSTVSRISKLAKQYVVTSVPNVYGLNGFISRTIRPKVYFGHKRIDKKLLRTIHEDSGLDTLFCDYLGGLRIIMPTDQTVLSAKHPRLAKVIDLPFRAFNLASKILNRYASFHPRTKFLSTGLMYIGKKNT